MSVHKVIFSVNPVAHSLSLTLSPTHSSIYFSPPFSKHFFFPIVVCLLPYQVTIFIILLSPFSFPMT